MGRKFEFEYMSDDELLRRSFEYANRGTEDIKPELSMKYTAQARIFLAEFNRRANEEQRKDNEKTNKIIKNWTIAIGIMTAVMLFATIVNVIVAVMGQLNG